MSIRPGIHVQLESLADKLDHWVARVRHPAQFWPQFETLAAEILDQCAPAERDQVRARLQDMLGRHGLERLPGHERGAGLPLGKPGP